MKKIKYCILLISILASITACKKDANFETLRFRIVADDDTKSHLGSDGYAHIFDEGDRIYFCDHSQSSVNPAGAYSEIYTNDNNFSEILYAVEDGHSYDVLFLPNDPASYTNANNGTFQFPITESTSYTEGNGCQHINVPMAGHVTINGLDQDYTIQMRNLMALVKVTVTGTPTLNSTNYTIAYIEMTASEGSKVYLSGNAVVQGAGTDSPTLTIQNDAAQKKSRRLYIYKAMPANGQSDIYYIPVPATAKDNFTFSIRLNHNNGIDYIYRSATTTDNGGNQIQQNKIYSVAINENAVLNQTPDTIDRTDSTNTDYTLAYPFSVSSNTRVLFTKGNLQYNRSLGTHTSNTDDGERAEAGKPGTWRMALHQYDVCGTANLAPSASDSVFALATDNKWVDLFGWGATGWPWDATHHGLRAMPWNCPNNGSANATDTYSYRGTEVTATDPTIYNRDFCIMGYVVPSAYHSLWDLDAGSLKDGKYSNITNPTIRNAANTADSIAIAHHCLWACSPVRASRSKYIVDSVWGSWRGIEWKIYDRDSPRQAASQHYNGNADWGVYNEILNAGNERKHLRTLKSAEWSYLSNTRANATNLRSYAQIVMADGSVVNGVIFLPDNWVMPQTDGIRFVPDVQDFTRNSYTLAQWAVMEEAGAAFLPAAGVRSATTPNTWDNNAAPNQVGGFRYWSVSRYAETNPTNAAKDSYIRASSYKSGFTTANIMRGTGCAVRLVQDYTTPRK